MLTLLTFFFCVTTCISAVNTLSWEAGSHPQALIQLGTGRHAQAAGDVGQNGDIIYISIDRSIYVE